jgi:hypothetical protein
VTPVAGTGACAYLRAMSAARLFRFLTILALVLMPVGMMPGGHAMAAAPAAASLASAHCAEMDDSKPAHHQPAQPHHAGDCAIACSALPSAAGSLAAPRLVPPLLHPLPSAAGRGLAPEAATPPPRFS